MAGPYYPRCRVQLVLAIEDWGAGTVTSYTLDVIPVRVEVVRNDHRTADTATVTLDLRDFPFDPRTFRACEVAIYLGDPGDPTADLPTDRTSLAFIGIADTPKATRAAEGSTVTLECRDFTALFLDTRWTSGALDVTLPLTQVVSLVQQGVTGATMVSGYSAAAGNLVLSTQIGRTKYVPKSGDNAWDVLCDLLETVGLVPVMELDTLLVLEPKDFGVDLVTFDSSNTLTPLSVSLRYGRDVVSLGYARHFKEARTMQVEVRAYDETKRAVQSARYPTTPIATKVKVSAQGKVTTTDAPILPFYVSGSYTQADLAALAERVWTDASRNELEVDVETAETVDADGTQFARVGNGTRLTIDIGNAITTDIAGMSTADAVAYLTTGDKALAPDVAAAFVASAKNANSLATQFYVREATHSWSREEGYRLKLQAINYVGGAA